MSTELNPGILDSALEIGARRANTLRQIRDLILDGKKDQAWELLLEHLGIEEKPTKAKVIRFPKR
ncbi:MAG: hypothetical protein AABN95_08060 [Acidobacteriota bacterium]